MAHEFRRCVRPLEVDTVASELLYYLPTDRLEEHAPAGASGSPPRGKARWPPLPESPEHMLVQPMAVFEAILGRAVPHQTLIVKWLHLHGVEYSLLERHLPGFFFNRHAEEVWVTVTALNLTLDVLWRQDDANRPQIRRVVESLRMQGIDASVGAVPQFSSDDEAFEWFNYTFLPTRFGDHLDMAMDVLNVDLTNCKELVMLCLESEASPTGCWARVARDSLPGRTSASPSPRQAAGRRRAGAERILELTCRPDKYSHPHLDNTCRHISAEQVVRTHPLRCELFLHSKCGCIRPSHLAWGCRDCAARDQQTRAKARPSLDTFMLDLDTHADQGGGAVASGAGGGRRVGHAPASQLTPEKLKAWDIGAGKPRLRGVPTSLDAALNSVV